MEAHCRICSRTEPFGSVPLSFRPEASQETISGMFTYCTQLEVSPDDSLPQKICSDCLENLTQAFEFKRLCHQSDASFRQMLREESRDEVPPATSTKTDSDTCPNPEVDENSTQCAQQTTTYQCCFEECDRKTADYVELQEHARKDHPSERLGNERGEGSDRRFVCTVCLKGFSDQLQWNMHRALLRGMQLLHECTRCNESFRTAEELVTHEAEGKCLRREEEEVVDIYEYEAPVQQDLIRRILNAKAKGDLVRINKEEHDMVLRHKAAFLERLHRNELKHWNKRVKLFYCCEACSFRSEISDDVQTHSDIGTCLEGFYMALIFCAKNLRCVLMHECESCDYRTNSSSTLKVHHRRHKHSGMRKSMTTRHVAVREYPCEYCGKISLTSTNRKRHRLTCLHAVENTISNELQKPLRMQDHESFPTEEKLATHGDAGEEEEKDRQNLIRRILQASATNSLVRISTEERDIVVQNKAAFLERLHRNELKDSRKRVKLFYVCEACSCRVHMRYAMLAHLKTGTCGQGFYMALGFCVATLRSVQLLECEMCDFRTDQSGNMKVHQRRRNHSGIRKSTTTKQVIEREYSCRFCGKISTHSDNNKRHQSACSRKLARKTKKKKTLNKAKEITLDESTEDTVPMEQHEEQQEYHIRKRDRSTSSHEAEEGNPEETTLNESKEPSLHDQMQSDDDYDEYIVPKEEYDEQEDYLLADVVMLEEYDPFEAIAESINDPEQETKTPTQELNQYSPNEELQPMPNETDSDTCPAPEVDENSSQCAQQPTTYQCCFEVCDRKTTDYIELKEHAGKDHQSERLSNERVGCNDRRFICTLCLKGFSDRLEWKIHRALLQGVQRLYECTLCNESFRTEEQLASHEVECRQLDEEEQGEDRQYLNEEVTIVQQDLIRRILDAKAKGDLVRISKEEHDIVLQNRAAFLKRLHRNELKHWNKCVKLCYGCEACTFRSETFDDVLAHLAIGICLDGFYMALGFCAQVLRCVLIFECGSCDYRCEHKDNLKKHHQRLNHSGMGTSLTTRHVVVREYPCEYCGKISYNTNNRKRHQRTCLHVANESISHELKKPLRMTLCDTTVPKEESEEPEQIKALNKSANGQDQETEPHTHAEEKTGSILLRAQELKKRSPKDAKLLCTICNYSTNQRNDLDLHLKTHEAAGREENKQHLIRRILKAKETNSLVRISQEERDSVLVNKAAFLERLHRNELKDSNKRVRLFYVCEACSFRAEMQYAMQAHVEHGTCGQGYYLALGVCAVNLRRVTLYECEMCDMQTTYLTNLKTHQRCRNHSGIRKSSRTEQVVERMHPCQYCGKRLNTFRSRKSHERTCKQNPEKTTSKKGTPQDDQLRSEEDEEQPDPDLITLKEYDPFEAINQSTHGQEPPIKKLNLTRSLYRPKRRPKKQVLNCTNCSYYTNVPGNLKRHLRSCSAKNPPKQSTGVGSTALE